MHGAGRWLRHGNSEGQQASERLSWSKSEARLLTMTAQEKPL